MTDEKQIENKGRDYRTTIVTLLMLYGMAFMQIQFPDVTGNSSSSELGLFVGAIIAFVCLAFVSFGYVSKERVPRKDQAIELFFALASLPAAGFLAANLASSVYFLANKAMQFSMFGNAKILCAFGVLAVGGFFFVFRFKYRFVYGLIEAFFGAAVGFQYFDSLTSSQLPSQISIFATLAGGVYLVVRGFDNMHNGMTNDPVGKRARLWIDSFLKPDEIE